MSRFTMKRAAVVAVALGLLTMAGAPTASAKRADDPKWDQDANGFADEGVVVSGQNRPVYAYDANGDWYWDLDDGRVLGSVDSVAELDQATLSRCDYVDNYRGTFENNAFQDTGWIQNHITCSGYDGHGHWNYLIVHESDHSHTP